MGTPYSPLHRTLSLRSPSRRYTPSTTTLGSLHQHARSTNRYMWPQSSSRGILHHVVSFITWVRTSRGIVHHVASSIMWSPSLRGFVHHVASLLLTWYTLPQHHTTSRSRVLTLTQSWRHLVQSLATRTYRFPSEHFLITLILMHSTQCTVQPR